MNESALVARVRELFSSRIGDDAAVVDGQVLTTDMLVEDVDFTRATALRFVARKSLAVNLSDVAAMGATPTWALVSLALPPWALESVDEMLTAYAGAAREYAIEIVGGDFSRSEKLVVSVTALGRLDSRALLRSGAKPGERVYVSRPLGGSAAGLALSGRTLDLASMGYAEREFVESAIRRHVDPEPEVSLGIELARIDAVSSCIDVAERRSKRSASRFSPSCSRSGRSSASASPTLCCTAVKSTRCSSRPRCASPSSAACSDGPSTRSDGSVRGVV
jgi:thiamine-monophosphate kinase